MSSFRYPVPSRDIVQVETAPDSRLQYSRLTGGHQDPKEQQMNTPHASQHMNSHGNEYELSPLDFHDDRHLGDGAVDNLLPPEASPPNSKQDESRHIRFEHLKVTASPVTDPYRSPARCRKMSALSSLGQVVLDLCIAATAIYFIAFAVMAISYEGDSKASRPVQNLLTAARFVSPPLAILSQHSLIM